MRGKRFVPVFVMIALFIILSSSGHADDGSIGKSVNDFGLKLFQKLNETEQGNNIIISPLSVSMALTMVYNGAEGETGEAMASTLELSGLSLQEIDESFKSLSDSLTSRDSAIVFQIANSIWYRQNLQVEDAFLDMNRTFFDARISPCNFGDPGTVDIINDWVSDNTNGKIPTVVGKPISPDLVMLLINAIYFHGNWTKQFDVEDTRDDQFTLTDGSTTACKMMNQEGRFRYLDNDTFQAIELPYGKGAFGMVIFLPKPGVGIDDLIGGSNADSLSRWIRSLHGRQGTISMPRFKLEYEETLNDVLSSLGMAIAFSGDADFSGISKGIFISYVKHKTYVEVNEEGTEAAAVTVVGMVTSAAPAESFVMRVDRPFLFLIRDSRSGTILFLGKITDPTQNG
jgi:serine protease inhibitor